MSRYLFFTVLSLSHLTAASAATLTQCYAKMRFEGGDTNSAKQQLLRIGTDFISGYEVSQIDNGTLVSVKSFEGADKANALLKGFPDRFRSTNPDTKIEVEPMGCSQNILTLSPSGTTNNSKTRRQ